VLAQQPWLLDPKVVEIPWREPEVPKKLSFGYWRWNKQIWPHPPVHRGVDIVIESLRKAGHEVIEWEPLKPQHCRSLLFRGLGADGGKVSRSSPFKLHFYVNSGLLTMLSH
jgi:amidase